MNVFRGLILVTMAVTAKGVFMDIDSGPKMTCPSHLHTTKKEVFCTVNVTDVVKKGCVLHGRYITVKISTKGLKMEVLASCNIKLDTGGCVIHRQDCPHCHVTAGVETRVYVFPSPSLGGEVECSVYCPRGKERIPTSDCYLLRVSLANVQARLKGHMPPPGIKLQCPSARYEIPFEVKCELYFSTLRDRKCTTTKGIQRYPVVNVQQDLLIRAGVSGVTAVHSARECQVELQGQNCVATGDCKMCAYDADIIYVTFEYAAHYATYGSLVTTCNVPCPSGVVVETDRFCDVNYPMAAYTVLEPKSQSSMNMYCPSLIPKIPYTFFCVVNMAQARQDRCLPAGVGVFKVILTHSVLDQQRPSNETITCPITTAMGVHQCGTSPQCPICRPQGKDTFYIPFRITSEMAEFKHHLLSCHLDCIGFSKNSRCDIYLTPGAGKP